MSTLRSPVSSQDHIQGKPNAPVTLVEYGDFQCSDCKMAKPIVEQLQEYFGEQIRFVFRHFPLIEEHSFTEAAAETAEFAADQGQFWPMYDLLFENQESFNESIFLELAKSAGLPPEDLRRAIENKTYAKKIQEDYMGGVKSEVNETPTFFINGQKYQGPIKFEEMVSAIQLRMK